MATVRVEVTENSVLSDLTVVVAHDRCDEGKQLIKEWMQAIKDEQDWQKANMIFLGVRDYDKHVKTCDACHGYELARWTYRMKVEEKK